jgi:hypothetical protein
MKAAGKAPKIVALAILGAHCLVVGLYLYLISGVTGPK